MAYSRLSPEQLPMMGQPAQAAPFSSAFNAGSSTYTPPPAGSSPMDAAPSNPFGGLGYADSPGIFGIIARLSGKPTRAEAYSQRAGGLEQESFKQLSDLIEQGMTPQKAFISFINSPKGHDLFVHDPNALGQVMNYLKTYSGPKENLTQSEKATDFLVNRGLITEDFANKWNAGLIKQEAVLNPRDGSPTGAYNYRDLSTGKTLQFGADSPVNNALAQDNPDAASPDLTEQDPWANMRKPNAAEGTTPTPTAEAGSAAPGTQNSQKPTRIATDAEVQGTKRSLVTDLKDADGNDDPADVIRAAGLVPSIQRWLGGMVGQVIPGLDARDAVAHANALTQIRTDAQSLQGVLKTNSRATKDDSEFINGLITQFAGPASTPTQLGQSLIQYNQWLDSWEVRAKQDAINPAFSRERRQQADATLGAIEQAKSHLPTTIQLEAKIDQLQGEPGTIETGIRNGLDTLRQVLGQGKEQLQGIEENKPLTYKTEADVRNAFCRGDVHEGDQVTINGQTFKVGTTNCGNR